MSNHGSLLRTTALVAATFAVMAAASSSAHAIPAFARKYKTSCTTCHTVFPKLNPFGEAFRRNGYRFPGVDGDAVKAEPVPLGQEAYKKLFPDAVWPGSLSPFPPLSVGFNGQVIAHPDTGSSAGAADGGSAFVLDNLVEEGHLWAGGSFDDSITYFGEMTVGSGGIEVESAHLHFNDLVGPDHLVNLTVGKSIPTTSSFGPHSTYLSDMYMPQVPITALYGAASDSYIINDNHQGAELTGTAGGVFDYSLGISAGTNVDVRNSDSIHGHVGYKLGGMPLDGEGIDAEAPQTEQAVTVDLFFVRSTSHFTNGAAIPATQADTALVLGGDARAEWGNLEFDTGAFWRKDDHALSDGTQTAAIVQWNELSYLAYPWLVPALRVEYLRVTPSGTSAVGDLRITPGAAVLIRPNLKLVVTVPIEQASGAPDAGWEPAGGSAAPATPTDKVGPELEAVVATLWYAY